MGDQLGVAVSGTLYYVPRNEFKRILSLSVDKIVKAKLFASLCRINTLYMIARAGSGHIGSSFSSMDIISWLQLNELENNTIDNPPLTNNIFFSSKGHDAPALYNVWIGLGKLDFELIHQLRRINGLPGHPDVSNPNVVTNTGSLGMGISKAKGIIVANRLTNKSGNIFVLTGDGELQEGQFWESLISAANFKMHELIVIIDHNKLQSDTLVSKVSDLGDLEAKLKAFGWYVTRCNGNDLNEFSETLNNSLSIKDKPKIIIADTIKGKGVSFMEHTSIDSDVELYKFHSGAPNEHTYVMASKELIDASNKYLESINEMELELETIVRPVIEQPKNPQRLINEYSQALIKQAKKNPKIVALDADLILDTGLIPFQKEFPDRFIECGIAEQDMVSQAGGIALQGLLPIVHSFSCFLSSRPNEQIYNNATERKKIIYVGSLAGILPGGPGHSHQAVRDISALSAIPGLVLVEPSCEAEVSLIVDFLVNQHPESSYLRLVSTPITIPYQLPNSYVPQLGKGVALTTGNDLAIISYGPVMLAIAYEAAEKLKQLQGINIKIINLPWLNFIDHEWLDQELVSIKNLISIDNHYRIGGQGDRIADAVHFIENNNIKLHRIALDAIPACGTNQEVLSYHSFDIDSVIKLIQSLSF